MKNCLFNSAPIRNFGIVLFFLVAAWPLTELASMVGDPMKLNFKEIEHQECEYIVVDQMANSGKIFGITHKGNCKNPIHTQKN